MVRGADGEEALCVGVVKGGKTWVRSEGGNNKV